MAEKSDRWVMIFLILVVIGGAIVVMRWAAKTIETSLTEHISLTAQLKTTMENQQDCIERNTTAYNEVKGVMHEVYSLLNKIYKKE